MDKIFIKGVLQLKDFFETKLFFEEPRISPKVILILITRRMLIRRNILKIFKTLRNQTGGKLCM